MRAAAELLALGVRTQLLAECVYEAFPLRRLRLQRRLLETLSLAKPAGTLDDLHTLIETL